MKIIIHALGANMGGAIRHLSNFIPVLLEANISNQYVLILRGDIDFTYENKALQIVRFSKNIGTNFFLRTIFDTLYFTFFAIKIKADVIISLLNFGPIFLTKRHINFQRNALFFCPDYIKNIAGSEKFYAKMRSALLYLTMKFATVIITPSNAMAVLIKKEYPSLSNKNYTTLHHGFRIQVNEGVNNTWERILREDKRIKILYPTHPAPHKGFEVLFEALAKIKTDNRNINFVLYTSIEYNDWPKVVGKYQEHIKQLGIEDHVVFTGRIAQDQMNVFYKNCDIMVYPSLCESFGFSMVEAMGYGLPIVAADTEVNKEICGDAAIYYSALNPEDAAEKIFECLSEQVREELKNKAKKRISSFDWSWERYVKEFLIIVENIR